MQSIYKQALLEGTNKKAPLLRLTRSYSDSAKFMGKSCKCPRENLPLYKWKREIPPELHSIYVLGFHR